MSSLAWSERSLELVEERRVIGLGLMDKLFSKLRPTEFVRGSLFKFKELKYTVEAKRRIGMS